jgi:hypothetical protein
MDRQTDRQIDKWIDGTVEQRWTDGQMDKWANGQVDKWTNGQMDKWTDGQMDSHYFLYFKTVQLANMHNTIDSMTEGC